MFTPQDCKILAVWVQVSTEGEHVCCARKQTVVLAAPHGRVLCVRAFGDVEDASQVLPSIAFALSCWGVPACLFESHRGTDPEGWALGLALAGTLVPTLLPYATLAPFLHPPWLCPGGWAEAGTPEGDLCSRPILQSSREAPKDWCLRVAAALARI